MTTYEVTVRRDGKFWYVEIPALDGATQARNLSEIDEMARDYIAEVAEVPADSFDLHVQIELPEAVQYWLGTADALRETEAAARAAAAEASRAAARKLQDSGLTLREIGMVLDVSHQRAQQLVSAPPAELAFLRHGRDLVGSGFIAEAKGPIDWIRAFAPLLPHEQDHRRTDFALASGR